jgi:uncharacterized membrane protein YidH (DUF202 family)
LTPRDNGAQSERTALAWSRTTPAMLAAGLLCARLAPSLPGALLSAGLVCGAAALLLRRAHTRLRDHPHARRSPLDPVSVLVATGLTILLGVVGVLFALASA